MKILLTCICLLPFLGICQSTRYYVNSAETASTSCNQNDVEINDLRVEVEIPKLAYEYDLIVIDLYEILPSGFPRLDGGNSSWRSSNFEYSGLTLRTATQESMTLSKNILNKNAENLKGDFYYLDQSDLLNKYTDTCSFYLGVYGYEIIGYQEKYNQGSNSYVSSPIYSAGTLLIDKVDFHLVQKKGWRAKQEQKDKEFEKQQEDYRKKERLKKLLTWGGIGLVATIAGIYTYFK
jgi:hypothetical protein